MERTAHADRFAEMIGAANVLTSPDDQAPYLTEWRDLYQGVTPMVLRPGSTEEVSAVMTYAYQNDLKVVPQGGNTGLVGGQIPQETGDEIVLSLSRLNKVRAVDPAGFTITAEAGVVLETLQNEAENVDRLFPLALGAQGSCQIGGNISTNAGGTAVLAYGNTRDLVLGLEVVLPTGEIWNGLRTLRKDNTGYDLKQLFIGGEGTLGIITAAALKLFPRPKKLEAAFVGLPDPHAALKLFTLAKAQAGPVLTGFEIMPRVGVEFCLRHLEGARDPLEGEHAWYVLMELSSGSEAFPVRDLMESILGEAFEEGLVEDAAFAQNLTQVQDFWHIRHGMSEVQKPEGGSIKHDVSVPVASIPDFLDKAMAAVEDFVPGCRPVPFGHIGDGNIHFNVSQPVGADKEDYLAKWDEMNTIVHGIVGEFGGSISAEHGIGRLKRDLLKDVKQGIELDLMKRIKDAFDPKGLLNPGRVL
ncbi:FAD-binding protein [Roseibium aggregatum]|jgi:FAD/FMN-containing dehydrogenase|uniref:FAD-binding oxidoreductase n=1 Tax=Stappiaceae TaxID=2821832 RepID=UPI001268CF59|nr:MULTISPECIES: FAD-binding oxidoreductase [Stappiaceae]MCR9285345.1 FAD-binding oxidoreductase [Paracoccaceae bacterium]MBO9457608.1 FAD-binding oxidoreductase [Labrenzia sp. R5_0]NKX62900.1 FAD-binding oxidoreductase [Labrenzia sp. 5N]QFT01344.1 putative FAD-linked oxidoreductase [Labrenzia sp. THAF191b]QFT07657.1 putative FAD-linked oxidoreductase [Labrenzia sp. THAF191a]